MTINCPRYQQEANRGSDCSVSTHPVLLYDFLEILDDFEAGGRIQAARRLIQEEDLGCCDELACDTQSPLLTSTDTLPYGSANEGIGLVPQSE